MGRNIKVKAYDLKVGDTFSSDATQITKITRIHTEVPFGKLESGIIIRIEGICHGNSKSADIPAEQEINLWED